MPTSCCVRGCKSKGNGIIKYFRFPRDVNRKSQWIKALGRENFVPTNNTMICEAHFTTNDYQKRPDLIKLTHTAIPSIFNCQKNEKQNASLKKVMDFGLKSSRTPARKRHCHLSDHTYVLKLPEESILSEDISFQKSISSSDCIVHTLNTGESCVLDIPQSSIHTLRNVENPGFKISKSFKVTSQPPKKNWENIAMTQQKTIHDLRKKIKVLHQKNRRYSSTIEKLQEQMDKMIQIPSIAGSISLLECIPNTSADIKLCFTKHKKW